MVDWGGLVDKGIDKIGDGIDKGKELVGEGVDYVTDKAGQGLDKIGAHDIADSVEDWGDETASSLGAQVGEQQLGQTEEANELIHGKPEKIAEAVKNLRDFQKAFDLVGSGMRKLDSGHWKGEAADAFREKFSTLPTDWLHAADAMENAAKALETYSKAVVSAQGKAREAIALYKEGDGDSKAAVATYNKKVDAYNAARTGDSPLPDPGPFSDPGKAKRQRAKEILNDARKARDEAGDTAKAAVGAALAHAPKEPTGRERAKLELMDYGLGQGIELAHFGGGIVKGTAGLLNFVRSVNPVDPYNLTHPAEYYKGVNMTLAGLVSTAANPDRALKNAWDAAKGDPSEFFGRLVPEVLGTKGAGVIRGGLRAGLKDAVKHRPDTGKTIADGPGSSRKDHEKDPNHNSNQCGNNTCDGDPVDMATGRMLLPQTDITLPGSLPLIFQRTFDSSHRSGRWFGPTWSSTVDQRLEIDSEGVIFSCDEGSLLAYPHPAPGEPVMPTHGRRWPMNRVEDGYTITDPVMGKVWHFVDHSEGLALLAQIDDRNGRWIVFEYDETGAPKAIVHHGGYHLKLTTSEGRVTALHLAEAAADGSDQEILRYGYTDGHLTEVTNSSGRPLRFGCDEQGRITSWTDTNGNRYNYVYDGQDRCVYQSGTNGHVESHFTWGETDPATSLRMTSITDGQGHTKKFAIDSRSNVVAEIDALGYVTRLEHDRHNRLQSRTDPLGNVDRYVYDTAGRLSVLVRPDGRRLVWEYAESGFPVRVVAADGSVTRQTFDQRGNRTSLAEPSGATTHFAYDERGHLVAVTDALGHTTGVRCDEAGLQVEVTDPLGATTRIERDRFGRPVSLVDACGSTARFEWTVEGHLARRIEADGSEQSWRYDGEGNCVSHTDALGGVTTYEYSDFDLLTARTGPDSVRYEFAHDTNLRLTMVKNPQGLTWRYAYDPIGRLNAETDFDNRTLAYGYDPAGRLISRTNGMGESIRFQYNALGQVVSKDVADTVTSFEYDVFDELTVATSGETTLTRLRDRYGRLAAETVDDRTVTFQYDLLGRRSGRTTPSGAISSWTYDPSGRLASLTTSGRTLTFERDASGREMTRHIGVSVAVSHAYDVMGRMTEQSVLGRGHTRRRRSYAYRADGNLVGIHDELGGTRRFDLDAIGRVTAVHAADWTERYAYDSVGNQTEASWPITHARQDSAGQRSYNGTQIHRAGNTRYEHDAQGRIVLRQKTRLSRKPDTWRYSWDAEDRLTSVVTPDGSVWRYQYDALGRRTSKQLLADDNRTVIEQVSFVWDDTTLCEQTTTAATLPHPVTLTWDHDGLHPLAQTERILTPDAPDKLIDERFFAIVTDLIGTPSELIDESGEIAWNMRSTLWGTTTWAAGSAAYTPLRFPGQYFDPETELHYNYFRYYDPDAARYLTPDPLGLTPAPTPRSYVSNPHSWSDPLGLKPCKKKTEDINWNEKSRPTFGHTFSEHGSGTKNTQSLTDRARTTGNDQGQWLDNTKAVEFLKAHHDPDGDVREVPIPPGLGQVIKPDGQIVEPTHVRMVPKADGTYRTAFPIVK
ncbi:putative T7SS-secreted protein [Streptomyces sp. NPDC055912]|uniref:putative T7SS-secreted protein n=1 Tax=Streptomyces sp. NPDC055912 TaxID=3345660 RepID=UPI0035E2938C